MGRAPVFDAGGFSRERASGKHALGKVDSQHAGSAVFREIAAVPAIAAAQIEHAFARDIGQHGPQRRPFRRAGKPVNRTVHAGIFGEKGRVVVFVLLHSAHPISMPSRAMVTEMGAFLSI